MCPIHVVSNIHSLYILVFMFSGNFIISTSFKFLYPSQRGLICQFISVPWQCCPVTIFRPNICRCLLFRFVTINCDVVVVTYLICQILCFCGIHFLTCFLCFLVKLFYHVFQFSFVIREHDTICNVINLPSSILIPLFVQFSCLRTSYRTRVNSLGDMISPYLASCLISIYSVPWFSY